MTNNFRVGTMLLQEGTPLPEFLGVNTEPYATGWSSVLGMNGTQLGHELESAGWTFFYMANQIHARGFGFDEQSRTDHAVAHVIKAVKREHCNCLEITQIRQRSFLGWHYTSLVAHARQIQRSRSFPEGSDLPPRLRSRVRESLNEQARPVRSPALFAGEAVESWENEGGTRTEG